MSDDETGTTQEDFDRMWERGEPVDTITPDPSRERLIGVVAEMIWLHGFKKTGTAASATDISPDGLAAAIVNRFTCTECGFPDMFDGNTYGECNDCAPQVAARRRLS